MAVLVSSLQTVIMMKLGQSKSTRDFVSVDFILESHGICLALVGFEAWVQELNRVSVSTFSFLNVCKSAPVIMAMGAIHDIFMKDTLAMDHRPDSVAVEDNTTEAEWTLTRYWPSSCNSPAIERDDGQTVYHARVTRSSMGAPTTDVEVLSWKHEHLVQKSYRRIFARGSYHNFLFVLYIREYEWYIATSGTRPKIEGGSLKIDISPK
ncbi:hypothetical protein IW262DRAFT_1291063 [Armillaria fumosa]|nr:hypothetical protein IW262DRAFT_1291063 [Armillaria fumosa]